MSSVFLPEPICDPAFVAALGLDPTSAQACSLSGYRVTLSARTALPSLNADPSAVCDGIRLPLTGSALPGLKQLFAAAGCALAATGSDGPADLAPMAVDASESFDAEDWTRRALPAWIEAIPDFFDQSARRSPQEVLACLPMLLSRARSRVAAKQAHRPGDTGFSHHEVQVDDRSRPYTGFFAVDEYLIRHPTYGDSHSPQLRRAVFIAADAVTVLPYDPARDRVLLVEQFRAGPFARGDRKPWLLEPIAGRIELGDTAEDTARKEAAEEAGLELRALHRIGEYYPSTGCFSEYLVSYLGIADLPDGVEGLHGVEHEGEDIKTYLLPRPVLLEKIAAGEMPDGPLILSAYWLELNRARILAG